MSIDSIKPEPKILDISSAVQEIENPSAAEIFQISELFSGVYPNYPLDAAGIEKFLTQPNVFITCIKVDGKIVAIGALEIEAGSNSYGSVSGIAVSPDFQGKRLGVAINHKLVAMARQKGLKFLQTDPVLNFEGDTGGGNTPNLSNLFISLKKNKYLLTGFSLAWFVDISRKIAAQDTSVARAVQCLDPKSRSAFNTQYKKSKDELNNYLKEIMTGNTGLDISNLGYGGLNSDQITSGNGGRLEIATSDSINDFKGTAFLPVYFLPCFGDNTTTRFVGVRYQGHIKTRTSGQVGENIFDLNQEMLAKILEKNDMQLLKDTIQILEINYASIITHSEPNFKTENL